MLSLTGSMEKETFNEVRLDGLLIVSIWGKITNAYTTGRGTQFVHIGQGGAFVHELDEVTLREEVSNGN